VIELNLNPNNSKLSSLLSIIDELNIAKKTSETVAFPKYLTTLPLLNILHTGIIARACPKVCVNDHKVVEIPEERIWSWHEKEKRKKGTL
jgi:hypothetical protein